MLQFDIAGDAAAIKGITTRRDAFAALVHAQPAPSATTAPANTASLRGWGTFADGVWQFEINTDDSLTLIAPSGQRRVMKWEPYDPQKEDRAFWR